MQNPFCHRSDAGSLTPRGRTCQQFDPCLHQRLAFLSNHAQERCEGIGQVMVGRVLKRVIGADRNRGQEGRQRCIPRTITGTRCDVFSLQTLQVALRIMGSQLVAERAAERTVRTGKERALSVAQTYPQSQPRSSRLDGMQGAQHLLHVERAAVVSGRDGKRHQHPCHRSTNRSAARQDREVFR